MNSVPDNISMFFKMPGQEVCSFFGIFPFNTTEDHVASIKKHGVKSDGKFYCISKTYGVYYSNMSHRWALVISLERDYDRE